MLYESLWRDREEGRFDRLTLHARHYANSHGWTRDLAGYVDACFEKE